MDNFMQSPEGSAQSGFDIAPVYTRFYTDDQNTQTHTGNNHHYSLTPLYPRFAEYKKRLESFSTFPPQILPQAQEICAAGLFYTGESISQNIATLKILKAIFPINLFMKQI